MQNSRVTSPRRLIKQVALESPPNSHQLLDATSNVVRSVTHEFKSPEPRNQNGGPANKDDPYVTQQRQRLRKVGPFAVDSQSIPDSRMKYAGAWAPQSSAQKEDDSDDEYPPFNYPGASSSENAKASNPPTRLGDDSVCHRCSECGAMFEEYSDEEIGIMVTILGTFIHREPTLAAPFLPEILSTVTK